VKSAEHVACLEHRGGAYRVLVVKREVKNTLGRPGHRWDDNIKMYPK